MSNTIEATLGVLVSGPATLADVAALIALPRPVQEADAAWTGALPRSGSLVVRTSVSGAADIVEAGRRYRSAGLSFVVIEDGPSASAEAVRNLQHRLEV